MAVERAEEHREIVESRGGEYDDTIWAPSSGDSLTALVMRTYEYQTTHDEADEDRPMYQGDVEGQILQFCSFPIKRTQEGGRRTRKDGTTFEADECVVAQIWASTYDLVSREQRELFLLQVNSPKIVDRLFILSRSGALFERHWTIKKENGYWVLRPARYPVGNPLRVGMENAPKTITKTITERRAPLSAVEFIQIVGKAGYSVSEVCKLLGWDDVFGKDLDGALSVLHIDRDLPAVRALPGVVEDDPTTPGESRRAAMRGKK